MSPLDDDDDSVCPTCLGTGIGQHGDPDTSRCHRCHGSGVLERDRGDDDDHVYEEWRDRQIENNG